MDGGTPETLTITDNSVIYSKIDVAAGNYFVNLKFTGAKGTLASVSELVVVGRNSKSEKTITLTNDTVKLAGRLVPGLYKTSVLPANRIGTQGLAEALTYIDTNAAASGETYIILLGADTTLSAKPLSYPGKTVSITLLGMDAERTISLSGLGSLFTVESGVTLTLDEKIKLAGVSSNTMPLITVNEGGTLFMKEGSKISGNICTASADAGGGVSVWGGAFTMTGGTISGNSGTNGGFGGVGVVNDGSFTMSGGTITGNSAQNGGGVWLLSGSTFTMNGGTISSNNAWNIGGGVDVGDTSTFNMTGGTISGNTVTGSSSTRYGGGVYVGGTGEFNMSGGTIQSNTASTGGGYYLTNAGNTGSFLSGSSTYSYYFSVTEGYMYGIQCDDRDSSGSGYTGDIEMRAYYSGTSTYIVGGSSYYSDIGSSLRTFTASRTGTVYINTRPYNASSSNTGTYRVRAGLVSSYPTYASYGGGVYVSDGGTFSKTSIGGTIAGGTGTGYNSAQYGDAVYIGSTPAKTRDSTVAETDALSTASAEGWD
jgi:hypothetical protein